MHYNNYFSYNSNNIKNIWKCIKQIITLIPQSMNLPNKIIKDDSIFTKVNDIANAFNDYFSNIGNNLANSLPHTSLSPLSYLDSQYTDTGSFYLLPVTSHEIEKEIYNHNLAKPSGPFSIPTKLLKLLKCYLSKPLEILFNISFSSGIVLDNFKIARVITVFKKGSQTTIVQYHFYLYLIES